MAQLPKSFTPEFLSQLELLKVRARRAFLGTRQGGHISPKRGHGIEFSDYRQYELGDNPRHIDWGVYARSDRLYVKRFQEEQDLGVLILVDTSASMFIPYEEGKWERARDIALALGYIALMEQDGVTLGALGVSTTAKMYGAKAIYHFSSQLDDVEERGAIDFPREVLLAASRIRFPGVALVISDLLMPFETIDKAFSVLRAKNLDITAIQVLSPQDIDPLPKREHAVAIDSETGEEVNVGLDPEARAQYKQLFDSHQKQLKEYFTDARINYVSTLSSEDLFEFIQWVSYTLCFSPDFH